MESSQAIAMLQLAYQKGLEYIYRSALWALQQAFSGDVVDLREPDRYNKPFRYSSRKQYGNTTMALDRDELYCAEILVCSS